MPIYSGESRTFEVETQKEISKEADKSLSFLLFRPVSPPRKVLAFISHVPGWCSGSYQSILSTLRVFFAFAQGIHVVQFPFQTCLSPTVQFRQKNKQKTTTKQVLTDSPSVRSREYDQLTESVTEFLPVCFQFHLQTSDAAFLYSALLSGKVMSGLTAETALNLLLKKYGFHFVGL